MWKWELAVYILAWVALIAAILSFFGIFGGNSPEEIALSMLLPIPDFAIIGFGALAILLGVLSQRISVWRGRGVAIAGAVCIVLSFTPIADVTQIIGYAASETFGLLKETFDPSEYTELSEEEYTVYAFLGSSSDKPEDRDIMEYNLMGYDGHAKGAYRKYKVCGYIFPNGTSWNDLKKIVIEVVLVDKDGNEILVDGEPIILTAKTNGGQVPTFETETVKAKKLPEQPYNFRVKRVLLSR